VSLVVPLDDCIARPDEGETRFPLVAHLEETAGAAGDAGGDHIEQLLFLAGLLHDAGKAQRSWQDYVRAADRRRRGEVSHAFLGSALFTITALELRRRWRELDLPVARPAELGRMIMQLACDIADHHGALRDLDQQPPWTSGWRRGCLSETDLLGLASLVNKYFPHLITVEQWREERTDDLPRSARTSWGRLYAGLGSYRRGAPLPDAARGVLRRRTARLVGADRFSSARVGKIEIAQAEAEAGLSSLRDHCLACAQHYASSPLTPVRQHMQEAATEGFTRHRDRQFFRLQVPTGYGKTLASLRIALAACRAGLTQRVVYVAPYLSILSQVAEEIRRATGLEVMEHHHLSVLQRSASLEWDDRDYLIMESWQAPIVATTFNQLFLALFPRRAQQTIRLDSLAGAFLIIDEPQIVDPDVWNLFLSQLGALVEELGMKCLLMTATMPSLDRLPEEPIALAEEYAYPQTDRYRMRVLPEQLEAETLAGRLVEAVRETGAAAAILNTIADATAVFEAARSLTGDDFLCINLHGAMHPLHKGHQIEVVRTALRAREEGTGVQKPVIVVSTQIIEAGVDLSFPRLFRARPILPSIIQAAGRANRHCSGSQAQIEVFDFVRSDGADARRYVYREPIAREVTDSLLATQPEWPEKEIGKLTASYYRQLFARKPGVSVEQAISDASAGQWSALGGIAPFGSDQLRVPVFVTREGPWSDNKELRAQLRHFGVIGPDELYEKYLDRSWRSRLPFIERKRLMSLLQRFTVSLPFKKAPKVSSFSTSAEDGPSILRVLNEDDYRLDTGFGYLDARVDDWGYL